MQALQGAALSCQSAASGRPGQLPGKQQGQQTARQHLKCTRPKRFQEVSVHTAKQVVASAASSRATSLQKLYPASGILAYPGTERQATFRDDYVQARQQAYGWPCSSPAGDCWASSGSI